MKPFIGEFSTQAFWNTFYCGGILSISKLGWKDIGFTPNGIMSGVGKGLLFGLVCAIFSYAVECLNSLFFFTEMFTYRFTPVVFP